MIHIGVSLLPSGLPGRKIEATIGYGLDAMHKLVLGPAQVIRQLEEREHSHSGGLSPSTIGTQSVKTLHVVTAVGMHEGIKRVQSSPRPLGCLQISPCFQEGEAFC
jgi:hypothetical protein